MRLKYINIEILRYRIIRLKSIIRYIIIIPRVYKIINL